VSKQARISIRLKIVFGYLLVAVCLGVSIYILNSRIAAVQQEIDYIVEHDLEVHNLVHQLEKNMLNLETGMRGFVASGEQRYLEPYNNAKARWEQDYQQLYNLMSNNPAQQRNLELIRSGVTEWINKAGEQAISFKRENKSTELMTYFQEDIGKNYMEQNRNQIEFFRETELTSTEARVVELNENNNQLKNQLYLILVLITIVSVVTALIVSGTIVKTITQVAKTIKDIAHSEGVITSRRIELRTKDEMRDLSEATNLLLDSHERSHWLQTSIVEVTTMYQYINSITELGQAFITKAAFILNATHGVFYLRNDQSGAARLTKVAAFADRTDDQSLDVIQWGEGLVGQSAKENRTFILSDIPEHYVKVSSGLGEAPPRNIIILPIEFEGKVISVIELASLGAFRPVDIQLLEQIRVSLGIAINNVLGRMEVERLLQESQALTEELQQQSEELQTQTEELQSQSEELLTQQEELRSFNESLMRSEERLHKQQEELELTNQNLEKQAQELVTVSKYKSEFLANMSHELRTPLNSLLILSQLLVENKDRNLTDKQIDFAHTIYTSGSDLLRLIDEILDLSKVEAGKMELQISHLHMKDLMDEVWRNFQPVAEKKNISFEMNCKSDVPAAIQTDTHRLQQILKNLLSNAIKFTTRGHVKFHIYRTTLQSFDEVGHIEVIAFSVEDTGIGVPVHKQSSIFEAFQQVDGTTSRKYGGTGLGLTISRELATLLGGGIALESKEGEGSTFTLYIPLTLHDMEQSRQEAAAASSMTSGTSVLAPGIDPSNPELLKPSEVPDDRDRLEPDDKVILIIEDDVHFAKVILGIAQSRGFRGLVALQGDQGMALAHAYKPDAIILDIQLPVIDGWGILDHLKRHPDTRHIPVHVMSVVDDSQQGLLMGAMAYMMKPTSVESIEKAFTRIEALLSRTKKRLLIVEDDIALRDSLVELIDHHDVHITAVATGGETLQELALNHYDCMVMDLGLSDMSGFELLDQIRQTEQLLTLPIIIYTGKDLDSKQELELKKYAESIIIKNVKSQDRLYDETALFLHRVEANLPEERRNMLKELHHTETNFQGKKILLVEDDIRNVFAISNVLEGHQLKISFAENGREAVEMLEQQEFDLILMDIMMPEMDGYEAMKKIRSNPKFAKLPIIALTAKAMKEDREKCIAAGASDYISKPINMDRLFSLLKVWLYR
jgi:CheY-like chemotaxis protein/CHASE3 domain sensor protein/GAF domain-containing protein